MNVNIDFTKNNIKVGYINENISTTLDIAIPEDMIDGSYKYRVVFQVHRFEQYKSDFVELDDNNHIIYKIPNVVAIKPTMDMQVVAYDESDGMVRKSKTVTLVFDKSVIGRDFIVDPFKNQVKVAELKWDEYNKTNMSSKKLIEYVKQGFFITFKDNILEVYDVNEEENFIIFYHLAVMDGRIIGIAFLTIRDNIIDITVRELDVSADIDSIEYDDEHSLHWKLDSIDHNIEGMDREINLMIPNVAENTSARHTHDNKTTLDNISYNNTDNLVFLGQEYYNAADVEQAIASIEGDLVEIYSRTSGTTNYSRYTGSELYLMGAASKGFSFKGEPVVNWYIAGVSNDFYFQLVTDDSVHSPIIATYTVSSQKVISRLTNNDKNLVFKTVSGVNLYTEEIVPAQQGWQPQSDDQIATKGYVDSVKGDRLPTATNVGDIVYWDGTSYVAGNISNVVTDADNIEY